MAILSKYIKFLRDYNRLLERGTKNIFDSANHIWVDNFLNISTEEFCNSIIPSLFNEHLDRETLVLSIKKPFKPKITIPESYRDAIVFDEAKNKFESNSDDILKEFLDSESGKLENSILQLFKERKRVYSKLFHAYNDLRSDTGQEIVLSLGLIQYCKISERNDNSVINKTNQHLFHFPLRVELLDNNVIKVYFSEDEKPYTDFFFLNNTPIKKEILENVIDKFEAEIEQYGFRYIYDENFKNLIANNLQQISDNSTFNTSSKKPISDQVKLDTFEISYSPAINIKAKKPRFFEKLMESIILFDQSSKPQVPLMDLLLRNPESKNINFYTKGNYFVEELYENVKEKNEHLEKEDFSTFFPLPFNNEQKDIFDKFQNNRLTVVTGPPGTGKSHSIVNILCTLLAQGKRVLVTAQTDKALESLLDKIPKQFDDLIFTKIKLANSNRFSLERSVDHITSILNDVSYVDIDDKISKLNGLKAKYVHQKNEVINLLGSEYKTFDLNESFRDLKNYEIFEKLNNKNKKEWSWVKDKITKSTLSKIEDIISAINIYKTSAEDEEFELVYGDFQKLIERFNNFQFAEFLEIKEQIKTFYERLQISDSAEPKIILNTNLDQIKFLLSELDNSDIVIVDIQVLNRLVKNFDHIEERKDDVFCSVGQIELIANRGKYISDIKKYISLIGTGKEKMSVATKIINRAYKIVKYLETITINERPCNTKHSLQELEKYIEIAYDIDAKINEIGKYSFTASSQGYLTLNEKIRSYNQLLKIILENRRVVLLLETSENLNNTIVLFQLDRFDLRNIYNISVKRAADFRYLQELLKTYLKMESALKELNESISSSDLKLFLQKYLPLNRIIDYSTLKDLEKALNEISKRALLKQHYNNAKVLLLKEIPKTLNFINEIPEYFINREAFEFAYAFEHLLQNELNDFQKIKENLQYYYNEISKAKSEILYSLSKKKFQEKFSQSEINEFINLLNNFKYNSAQASRGIQNSARFKSLARKNSVEISHKLSCWVMKFNDALNSLGNEPEIFDCIIVDEASQLDFNSLLLGYYAKNMIIVGDDKQTSPSSLSGISQDDLNVIRDKNLEYLDDEKIHIRNDNSLFSLAKMVAGNANLSLKEHFRCVPEIIAFSKNKFYNSSLRPLKQVNNNRLIPKVSFYIKDSFLENRRVVQEIQAIKEYLITLFSDSRYEDKSIGIVSLGSTDHTERLSEIVEELMEVFSKEKIEKHNLIIDDPARFQGDERDVMLISLGVAFDLNKMEKGEEYKPNRIINNEQNLTDSLKSINVALSRAKEQMILFHSIKAEDLKSGDFRIEIINFFYEEYTAIPEFKLPSNLSNNQRSRENVPIPFDSWFEYDIAEALMRNNFLHIKPQYEVKEKELWVNPKTGQTSYVSFKLDLVVFSNGKAVAIECDGDPFHSSPEDIVYDVERQEFLERVGWKIYRILYSKYRNNPKEEVERMVEFVQRITRGSRLG